MQLTKQTDFAFRVLLYLGGIEAGKRVSIREVCEHYDISHNHVAKIVLKLTTLNYIDSTRGHGGGIQLAKSPEMINVAQVITDFETTLQPVNCTSPRCKIISTCRLKDVLAEASSAFLASASNHTLADLLAKS
ncbi:MAG: BadM/Rrf2 family transcriptional regulator [Spongiibacteraceae bacterium]|nr:BadM/Rrf2 family transcriptional regulator [Spongiibacteraceae bacterium]